jgi:hypothetical protein
LVIISEAIFARTHHTFNPDTIFGAPGLARQLRSEFRYGRQTQLTCEGTDLVPKAEDGCGGIEDVFHDHIFVKESTGMSWRYVAALSAAHGLGGAKPENSGFDGFFSDSANVGKFSNNYYKQILQHGWTPERGVGGNPDKIQWQRADNGKEEGHKQMMLDSDLCLAYKNNLKCGARDENGVRVYDCHTGAGTLLSSSTGGDCCAFTKLDRLY